MDKQTNTGLIDYLSATTDDVVIATSLKAGGEIRTEIWAVVIHGEGYIRSGFGPRAVVSSGTRRYTMGVVPDTDTATTP